MSCIPGFCMVAGFSVATAASAQPGATGGAAQPGAAGGAAAAVVGDAGVKPPGKGWGPCEECGAQREGHLAVQNHKSDCKKGKEAAERRERRKKRKMVMPDSVQSS